MQLPAFLLFLGIQILYTIAGVAVVPYRMVPGDNEYLKHNQRAT